MAATSLKDVSLTDAQLEHANRELDILTYSHVVFDGSDTGLGKTICSLYIAKEIGSRYIVFGNKKLEAGWKKQHSQYNLPPFAGFVSYESGARAADGRAAWVTRIVNGYPQQENLLTVRTVNRKKEYLPTETLIAFLSTPGAEGRVPLLIFDEVQGFKNKGTSINSMVKAIAKVIQMNPHWGARMIFLSATSISAVGDAEGMCRGLGFIRHERLFNKYKDAQGQIQVETLGMGDLVSDIAELIQRNNQFKDDPVNENSTLERISMEPFLDMLRTNGFTNEDNFARFGGKGKEQVKPKDLIFSLFVSFLIPLIGSSIESVDIPSMKYRGFFNITGKENIALVNQGVQLLKDSIKIVPGEDVVAPGGVDMKGVFQGLHMVEQGCIDDVLRLAITKAKQEPSSKHIIVFDLVKPSTKMRGGYETPKFSSLQRCVDVLTSQYVGIPAEKIVTATSLNAFMKPQTLKKRVSEIERWKNDDSIQFLLGQKTALSVGLDLHDESGDETTGGLHKRYLWIIPDFDMIKMHQLAGRIFRAGSTTVGECYYVYPLNTPLMMNLLKALDVKSRITKAARRDVNANLIKYPGEVDRYVEPFPSQSGQLRGGFLDESIYGRTATRSEKPINEILLDIYQDRPVHFVPQHIPAPNWELVRLVREYKNLGVESGTPLPPGTPSSPGMPVSPYVQPSLPAWMTSQDTAPVPLPFLMGTGSGAASSVPVTPAPIPSYSPPPGSTTGSYSSETEPYYESGQEEEEDIDYA